MPKKNKPDPKKASKRKRENESDNERIDSEEEEQEPAVASGGSPPPSSGMQSPSSPSRKRVKRASRQVTTQQRRLLAEEDTEQEHRHILLQSHTEVIQLIGQLKADKDGTLEVTDEDFESIDKDVQLVRNLSDYEKSCSDVQRLVLIGGHGQGKSLIANYILDPRMKHGTGPFKTKKAIASVTSHPMVARYGSEKRICAVYPDGKQSLWYDWEELEETDDAPLSTLASKHHGMESFLLEWPSLVLHRLNIEITDLPGFDPNDSTPTLILRKFIEGERTYPVHKKATLMLFVPHNDRGQVDPHSHLHLPRLEEAGLFLETNPSELPPFVFVRNNSAGLNDEDSTARDDYLRTIPHIRKVLFNAFCVRDSELTEAKEQEIKNFQTVAPCQELKVLHMAAQFADTIANTSKFWFVELKGHPLIQDDEVSDHHPFVLLVRTLRAQRRSQLVRKAAERWLHRLMLPIKFAFLAKARTPTEALKKLKAKIEEGKKALAPLIKDFSQENGFNFWHPKLQDLAKKLKEVSAKEDQGYSLTDDAIQQIRIQLTEELLGLVEGKIVEQAKTRCQEILLTWRDHVAQFAAGKFGDKNKSHRVILMEMGDLIEQQIDFQEDKVLDLREGERLTIGAYLSDAFKLHELDGLSESIKETAKELGIGMSMGTLNVLQLDETNRGLIVGHLISKVASALKIALLMNNENQSWSGSLCQKLIKTSREIKERLEAFSKNAIPESRFFGKSDPAPVGTALKPDAVEDLPIFKLFEKCKALDSRVKKLENRTSTPLGTLPPVEIKLEQKNSMIIGRLKNIPWTAKKCHFSVAVEEQEDLSHIEAHVDSKKKKLRFKLPAGADHFLRHRYNNQTRTTDQLYPIIFASKLLTRNDENKSVLFPHFHLRELQATHPRTVVFVVVSNDELDLYSTLLSQYLWDKGHLDNKLAVFLVSVHLDVSPLGWMNAGRCWQIGKLLLEQLDFAERYYLMSDRYKEFRFWTSFRSWRRMLIGPALELQDRIMSNEQSIDTVPQEFVDLAMELSREKIEPDAGPNKQKNEQMLAKIAYEISYYGISAWTDVVWKRNACAVANRHLVEKIQWTSHTLKQALSDVSKAAGKRMENTLKETKNKVAMISLEESRGSFGGDGFSRGQMAMTIGGQPSHRPSLGKCLSPLVSLPAARGIELINVDDFFASPIQADELMKIFKSKSDKKPRKIPQDSVNDVFNTNDALLAANGFSGTLKMFAANLFLARRLTFRNTLVSYSHALPQRRSKKEHCKYLFFTRVTPSRLDHLRAGSVHISQTMLRWPSRAITYLEYYSDGVMSYAEDKAAIECDVLETIHAFQKLQLSAANVFPDENCLFSALSGQVNDDINKDTGQADKHLEIRVKVADWIAINLDTVLHGKTVREWIASERHSVSIEEYIEDFRQDGTSVGSCVALLAASHVLKRPIFVFRSDHKLPIEFSSLNWIGVDPVCIAVFVAKGVEEGHFFSLRSEKSWKAPMSTVDRDADGGGSKAESLPTQVKQEEEHMEVDGDDPVPKKSSSKKDKKQHK